MSRSSYDVPFTALRRLVTGASGTLAADQGVTVAGPSPIGNARRAAESHHHTADAVGWNEGRGAGAARRADRDPGDDAPGAGRAAGRVVGADCREALVATGAARGHRPPRTLPRERHGAPGAAGDGADRRAGAVHRRLQRCARVRRAAAAGAGGRGEGGGAASAPAPARARGAGGLCARTSTAAMRVSGFGLLVLPRGPGLATAVIRGPPRLPQITPLIAGRTEEVCPGRQHHTYDARRVARMNADVQSIHLFARR